MVPQTVVYEVAPPATSVIVSLDEHGAFAARG